MQSIADDLDNYIEHYINLIRNVAEDKMHVKLSPTKWSKQEILGHLIDSAQNNIRRFIVAQYENEPYIRYDQDKWVAISNYQQYPVTDLINLWYLLNKHMAMILKNTSADALQRKCKTEDLHTIEWLATDYIKHLRHHIHQILDSEPIAYP
jgi:hypothetical protein